MTYRHLTQFFDDLLFGKSVSGKTPEVRPHQRQTPIRFRPGLKIKPIREIIIQEMVNYESAGL